MALLHQATLTPSKLELLSEYVVTVPGWTNAAPSEFALVGAYRFDDPAGQVGIEMHLLAAPGEAVLHVPVVYRGAPHEGAEASLLGTLDHSVLGKRWVYDACTDSVFVAELARTILTGATQVELVIDTPDGMVVREPVVTAQGSGEPGSAVPAIDRIDVSREGHDSVLAAGGLEMVVRHVLGDVVPAGTETLTATWDDNSVAVAVLR